jgi:hypothetical protein
MAEIRVLDIGDNNQDCVLCNLLVGLTHMPIYGSIEALIQALPEATAVPHKCPEAYIVMATDGKDVVIVGEVPKEVEAMILLGYVTYFRGVNVETKEVGFIRLDGVHVLVE